MNEALCDVRTTDRNDRPDDYLKGFPWHPHRVIETITCVLAGTVEHGRLCANLPSSLKMTAPRDQDVFARDAPRSPMTTGRACA